MAESLAPYHHYRQSQIIRAAGSKPIVNVDIGGGTTDVVVFMNEKPQLQTSFRMAANTIFGDGIARYGGSSSAFVAKYRQYYQALFAANKQDELKDVMEEIVTKGRAQDIHAFFFSVEEHRNVRDRDRFSYGSLLSADEDLKIVFVYFYTAIVYHIAKLMSAKGLAQPRYASFSGTGSKILRIITSNNKLLEAYTRQIIEDAYERPYDADGLSLIVESSIPKEVTCKGGLLGTTDEGTFPKPSVFSSIVGREFETVTYQDVLVHLDEVVASIQAFNTYFLSLNGTYNMVDTFNVSPGAWKKFSEELPKDLRAYVEQELDHESRQGNAGATDVIAESPFFYGIKGTISALTTTLCGTE
ncbi:MAG: hypothetical protein FGM24_07100 [Candidatus Kapabacteria bacterium]|nr:hypothetical protein [Candidatus Kapabacteria bacterium]